MAVRTFSNRTFGEAGSTPTAPATPTLTFVDDADGTGGVGTVAGSTSGSTNVIWTMSTSGLSAGTWTSSGSRTSDGAVNLTLAVGLYWGYVASTTSGGTSVSVPVYFLVTSGDDSIFEQCLDAVVARIQGLSLTGISSGQVQRRKVPWDRNWTPPYIAVCPLPEQMQATAGTNERDDVGYAVLVTMLRASNGDLTGGLDTVLKWRERITTAFQNQRLSPVDEVWRCSIEPGPVFQPDSFKSQYDVCSIIIRCMARQGRNLT